MAVPKTQKAKEARRRDEAQKAAKKDRRAGVPAPKQGGKKAPRVPGGP